MVPGIRLIPADVLQGGAASMTAQAAWTPLWAAPEVFRQERATVKADIWSFGIILWELVSKQNVAEFPAYGMTVQMAVSLLCRPGCAAACAKLPDSSS